MNRVNEYGLSENKLMQNHTVSEILIELNYPAKIDVEHSNLYLYLNQVGTGDTYHGVSMLTEWYRKIFIFLRIYRI